MTATDKRRDRPPRPVVLLRPVPGRTVIHQLWAGTKLLVVAGIGVLLTLYPGWLPIGLVGALVVVTAWLAHIPAGVLPSVPKWLWVLLFIGALTASFAGGSPHFTVGSVDLGLGGLLTFLRVTVLSIVLLGLGGLVSWTTNVAEVAPAVAKIGRPLRLFRLRNLATSNLIGILWAAAMFAWFFLSALYMQLVLGYTPAEVGFAFLPANLIMAAFSLGLSAKLVMRFGIRIPLAAGLALATAGLLLFARAPVDGTFIADVLPGMLLLGFGGGIAFNPVLLAAMSDVGPSESGLASGVVNTSFMMGGALGLAVLASLAATRSDAVLASGADPRVALDAGYRVAFLVGALFAAAAAVIGATVLRAKLPSAGDAHAGEQMTT